MENIPEVPRAYAEAVLTAKGDAQRAKAYRDIAPYLSSLGLKEVWIRAMELMWGDEYASIADVAEKMDVHSGTVSEYISSIKNSLRELLENGKGVDLPLRVSNDASQEESVLAISAALEDADTLLVDTIDRFYTARAPALKSFAFAKLEQLAVYQALGAYEKKVMRMKYGEKMTAKDVAAALSISVNAVSTFIRGANKIIRCSKEQAERNICQRKNRHVA